MPEGPLGGPRPLANSRIKLVVFSHPKNPSTAEDVKDVIVDMEGLLGVKMNNVVEQNINTNEYEEMSSEGFVTMPVVEFPADFAISINRWGKDLKEFQDKIFHKTGGGVFIIAE